MTQIDQFESVFRSAAKDVFRYREMTFERALLVTDLTGEEEAAFAAKVKQFVQVLEDDHTLHWTLLNLTHFADTEGLLEQVAAHHPDLICTYRNLGTDTWRFPHSLGEHLDVLAQCTRTPVLVLPHPRAGYALPGTGAGTQQVMALTDHLAGDGDLINYAVHFTRRDGTLLLTHIEDVAAFERIMEAVSKIPTIDTEETRARLAEKLLQGPDDFIQSARKALANARVAITVETHVAFGKRLQELQDLIEARGIDLLVMNTKDEDQPAMHGLSYPLAVALRRIPLLML